MERLLGAEMSTVKVFGGAKVIASAGTIPGLERSAKLVIAEAIIGVELSVIMVTAAVIVGMVPVIMVTAVVIVGTVPVAV